MKESDSTSASRRILRISSFIPLELVEYRYPGIVVGNEEPLRHSARPNQSRIVLASDPSAREHEVKPNTEVMDSMKADTVDAGQFSISSLARSNVHNVASSNNPLTRPSVKPIVQPARRRRVGWTATTKDTTIASSDSTTPVATTALAAEGRRWSPRGSARTSTIRTPAPCRRANLDWRGCVRSDRVACERQVERALLDVGDEHRVEIGLQVARASSTGLANSCNPIRPPGPSIRRRYGTPSCDVDQIDQGVGPGHLVSEGDSNSAVRSRFSLRLVPTTPVNDSFSASRRVVMSGSRWFHLVRGQTADKSRTSDTAPYGKIVSTPSDGARVSLMSAVTSDASRCLARMTYSASATPLTGGAPMPQQAAD